MGSETLPPPRKRSKAEIAAICATAAALCAPLTMRSEGVRLKPYLDPAHVLTVCYGETHNIDPALIYSANQCTTMLRKRLAEDYAPRILQCLPELWDQQHIKVFGALLDAAYNAGSVAVCRSRMAVSIHAGNWGAACDGFYGWYTTATDRRTGQHIKLKGLVTRRAKEAVLCSEGVSDAAKALRPSSERVGPVAPDPNPSVAKPAPVVEPWWHRWLKHLGLVQ
jgi:lysozyme